MILLVELNATEFLDYFVADFAVFKGHESDAARLTSLADKKSAFADFVSREERNDFRLTPSTGKVGYIEVG